MITKLNYVCNQVIHCKQGNGTLLLMIAYPDHLLTDSHELKVEFRVDHLSLLQFKDLLVTTLG